MSGIELAGLVLGAFPIIIHALESYREGAELLTDWWRIQRAYKKCQHDLGYHQVLFQGNVERFLLPLVVDDSELKRMMADPAGGGWEDPQLETRLRNRLPKSYHLFLDIIKGINELMENLGNELGVNDPKFLARVTEAKRIKFSLKKSSRERLFNQLQEGNERMRNLLESSDQINSARLQGPAARVASMMSRKISEFWLHAMRLHEALSKAWLCSCVSHVTNLGLEHRTSDKVEFDVIFHLQALQKQQKSWQGTKINMITTPTGPSLNVPHHSSSSSQTRRQVRWASTDTVLEAKEDDSIDQITDLCSALSSRCPGCIGFLEADEYRFVLHPHTQATSNGDTPTITLKRILQDTQILTRRKRYCLALTLASSYLQLGSTPWLGSSLRKDSIIFLQPSSDPESTIIEHPYIQNKMSRDAQSQTSASLSSLGICLLELCFGTTLEATQFRKQLPPGDSTTAPVLDYAAAIQWSKLAAEEAGLEFAEAIDWCLRAKEAGDGSWRKEFWQHVIVPLDTCHKQVSQKAPVF